MFDLSNKVDAAAKLAACAAAFAAAAVAAFFFVCLALFVWTQQQYGTAPASLVLAALLAIVAMTAAGLGWIARRRAEEHHQRAVRDNAQWWADPTVIAAALEVYRAIGSKRMSTILVGAFVVGTLLSRPNGRQPDAGL
jgi:hypothetical protein